MKKEHARKAQEPGVKDPLSRPGRVRERRTLGWVLCGQGVLSASFPRLLWHSSHRECSGNVEFMFSEINVGEST